MLLVVPSKPRSWGQSAVHQQHTEVADREGLKEEALDHNHSHCHT